MGIDIEKRDIFDLSFVTRSAKNQMRNWKIEKKILILQVYYKLPLPLTTDEYSMNFSELIWSTGHLFNCSFFRYFPYYFTYIQFLTIPLSWAGSCKYNNELWISKGGVSQADNKKGASQYRPQIVAPQWGPNQNMAHEFQSVNSIVNAHTET